MALKIELLLLLLSSVRLRCEDQCVDDAATVHLTASSRRNSTGHYEIKAGLKRKFLEQNEELGTDLDVLQSSGRCGNLQYLQVEATATAGGTGVVAAVPSRSPPGGYELFPGLSYYKLFVTRQSWADAQETCQRDGGNLIVINSDAEAEVVKTIYARKNPDLSSTGIWAGYHALFKPAHFVTVFGDSLSKAGYEKWNSAHPMAGKLCGDTYLDGLLHTWNCEVAWPFLCEFQS